MNLTKTISPVINKFDRVLFAFILIFLASMTNSIFLNQIGYFGALFMLLARWYKTGENKFFRTGLEIPFILFLTAELVSALFSINQSQAFTIFFKRLLLIPVVYMIAASADSDEKAKLYFKVFVVAALLTVIVYLGIAYRHYILQLYRLESKGPSVFQYVMTAGGLMSFIVIILFAFLVNEKTELKYKVLIIISFMISSAALISSYTRAAWLGAFAGILFILFIKKYWRLLTLLAGAFILLLFISQRESKIWSINPDNIEKEQISFDTEGRAVSFYKSGSLIYIADYEKGVTVYDMSGNLIHSIPTEAPATRIEMWKPGFVLIYLIDSRFHIGELFGEGKIKLISSSQTPGLTRDLEFNNSRFYTADFDSGLTVYNNPLDLNDRIRYPQLEGIARVSADSSGIATYDIKRSLLSVYGFDGDKSLRLIDTVTVRTPTFYVWKFGQTVLFQTDKNLLHYQLQEDDLTIIKEYDIQGIFRIDKSGDKLFGATVGGKFYKIELNDEEIKFDLFLDIEKNITDFASDDDRLVYSTLKLNRLASIIDPYHETNIERLHLWRTGFKILADYPLFGVGDIDLGQIYSEYKPEYVKENYGHLHNNYIHFLVILGIAGFIIVVYLLYSIFALNLRIYKQLKDIPFSSSYSLGTLGAFTGFLVSGLAEWNFGDQEIITMVWFTLGLNIAFYKMYIKDGINKNPE